MANRLQKCIYYLTAEVPLLFVVAIVLLIKESKWDKPCSISWRIPLLLVVIGVAMCLLFNWFFSVAQKDLAVTDIKAGELKTGDGWLVAYVITYMIPLTSLSSLDYVFPALGVVLLILLIVLTFTDFVTPHPLLFIKGYHFYEISGEGAASEYKLISKKRLRKSEDVKKVSRVFEFLLIRKG